MPNRQRFISATPELTTSGALRPTSRRQTAFILLFAFLIALATPFITPIGIPTVHADTGTGSVSLTALGTAVTENFDTLSNTAGSTTNAALPTGWYITETGGGARDNEQYGVDTGGSNTGDTYSYGSAAATDRALGGLRSGTLVPLYGASFTNSTGTAINQLDIAYTGEQWRLGASGRTVAPTIEKIDFQISTNATSLTSGTYTDVNNLDFQSPIATGTVGALNGNSAANRSTLAFSITGLNIPNGATFFIRWTDLDVSSSDDGLAVDDFSITPQGAGPTNPTGVGDANPSSVPPGGTTLLTVAVTPGTNPASVTHTVAADLSAIGGSNNQAFSDDGVTNGDVTAGDNTFSYSATVSNATTGGLKNLPATITETSPLSRTGNTSISLTVLTPTNPSGVGSANPNSLIAGGTTLLTVAVTPGANPPSTGITVVGDLSSIGGSAAQSFFDNATNGDVTAGDNTFSFSATVAVGTSTGGKILPIQISDDFPRTGNTSIALTIEATPPANDVVISQIYGGGGNTGATLTNDYIELINHSGAPVNLDGWSVQAFVSLTGTWQMTPLPNVILQPGQYFLIQEAAGEGGTDDLPEPDAFGTIPVSSTSTKVALLNNTTLITTSCPSAGAAGIVDLVGYGGTDCFEGSPAPALTNTTALLRQNNGCFDTNNNANNFVVGNPSPRNSSSPFNDCTGLSGIGSANPTSVVVGASTTLTVHVAPAQNPASSGITVTADLSQIGGSPTQVFSGGPTTFTFVANVPGGNPTGVMTLPVTIQDAQSRVGNTNIVVKVIPVVPDHVTISQLYGGGGNGGATYKHDFVELYNPHTTPFDLTGWSIQYGAATGETWQVQPLGGAIGPGEYYLIRMGTTNSTVGTFSVPPANVSGDINMGATAGKIALVNNFDQLVGPCPVADIAAATGIVDFLGYGTTANCAEGTRAAAPSNTTSLLRKNGGITDTDNNSADFVTGTPNPRQTAPIVEIGPAVFGTDPRNGATTAPRDATIVISFTEPVNVDEGWYDITCVSTNNHNSATVRSFFDGDTYTITPNVNFLAGEQCTVTIFKDAVHDVDTEDTGTNADTLPANKVFTFTVANGAAPPYPTNVHLTMGNPSGAALIDQNNYLMEKPEFSLSYNRSRGTANWVSWHLSDDWTGTLARVDTFRADPEVPDDWFRVSGFDYVGSGFDRGHMVPNADRDKQTSVPINQATFLMTNMIPQSPDNNQGPWANLEGYLRTLNPANEIYIVAGGAGTGGTGSAGAASTIAGGNVTVPAQTWKVALILPKGSDDVTRVNCSTRTLAVIMPNIQGIRNNPWENYITTVDAVEALTGYDFFSSLPDAVENCVEAGNNGTNPPATANQSASTPEDTAVEITLQAVRPDTDPLTFSIVSGPTNGMLSSIGTPSCTDFACTATVTYTPDSNFNGADSFTFKVNDGTQDSNTSTVTISVSPVNDAPVLTSSVAVNLISSTNSNLFNVGLLASATDVDGDTPTIQVAVFGDEDDQTDTLPGVVHSPDAKDIAPETLRLRGERIEANNGRVYLIIVTADDGFGGIDRNYHTVVVPKNNKPANIDAVLAEAAAAAAFAESNGGTPPPGYFVIGDGPVIGPKQ